MAKQTINLGTGELTGDGESIRSALIKVNENFTEVYADIAAVGAFSGDYDDLTNKPTIPSFNQDLNSTDDVAFNTISTPNLILDGDVTTSNELFIDGGAQAIGIKSQVSIVLDGDVNFQNGNLTVAGNIEVDGSFINNSVSDGSGLQVETTSDFEIKVDTAIWSFEPNDGGRIQFPDGSTQTTAYTGFDQDLNSTDDVAFNTISVIGNTALASNVNIGADLTVTGNSSTSGNESVLGTFDVTGNATLSSDVTVGGNLETSTVTASSGNLTLSADNYVIIDSNNNGQINIGLESGIGNVLLGNIDNGTDVIVNGRLFHGGGIAPASSIGADGDFKGEVVFDNSYIYYCTANYDGVANIWKRVAWSTDTW